jgi:hypothetical protein
VQREDQRWALPGGDSVRYIEAVLLARYHRWRSPELIQVRVLYRVETEGKFLAPNTATSIADGRGA